MGRLRQQGRRREAFPAPATHASTFAAIPSPAALALHRGQELERRLLVPHVEAEWVCLLAGNCWLIWSAAAAQQREGVEGLGLAGRAWCLAGAMARQHLRWCAKAIDFACWLCPLDARVVRFVPPLVIKPRQLNLARVTPEQACSDRRRLSAKRRSIACRS